MKAIVLAFTLKDQDQDQIIKRLKSVCGLFRDHIVIHGFMPRKVLEEKGFSTAIVDTLDECFPVQLNMFMNGAPLRDEMGLTALRLDAKVIVIGKIAHGVKEEIDHYKTFHREIVEFPLES